MKIISSLGVISTCLAFYLSFSYLLADKDLPEPSQVEAQTAEKPKPNKKNEKIQSEIIMKYLSKAHYQRHQRKIDDQLSKDAFKFLIERFDPQKAVFLQNDVDTLGSYELKIDDEFLSGEFELINAISKKYNLNKQDYFDYCNKILDKGFDFSKKEFIELDGEKLQFCKTSDELNDRWRKRTKYRVIDQYLIKIEKEKTKNDKKEISKEKEKELQKKSIAKVRKQLEGEKRSMKERNHQDDLALFYNTITNTYDPHTTYMSPMNKKDFDIRMSRSLTGIGVRLRRDDDGYIKIVEVILGSAAHREGSIRAGDVVLSVAQGPGKGKDRVDTVGMKLEDFRNLVLGEKGTIVQLEVKKLSGDIQNIVIERDIIQLEDAVAKSNIMYIDENKKEKYGYIQLPSFYRDFSKKTQNTCTNDVIKEINKLKKENIKGLIFDLRNNGGGALRDAISISGLFIERGPIVQVKDTMGKISIYKDRNRKIEYDGPLVILVNQFSASASEILAGAMQDYGRAVIIGTGQTHGKGTVQNVMPLKRNMLLSRNDPDFGAIKMTIQKFYRITGSSTQNKGVMPDIILPGKLVYSENGERHKEFAMPWDTIKEANYAQWEGKFSFESLQKKSDARTSKNDKFRIIKERYDYIKNYTKDTKWPLEIDQFSSKNSKHRERVKHFNKILEVDVEDLDYEEREARNNKLTPEELKEQRNQEWLKNLKRDPYVKESLRILSDIIESDAA